MDIPLELVMCHRILDCLHSWLHLASLHIFFLQSVAWQTWSLIIRIWWIWSEVACCYIHVFNCIDTQFPSILKLALAFCVEVVEWEAFKHNPQVEFWRTNVTRSAKQWLSLSQKHYPPPTKSLKSEIFTSACEGVSDSSAKCLSDLETAVFGPEWIITGVTVEASLESELGLGCSFSGCQGPWWSILRECIDQLRKRYCLLSLSSTPCPLLPSDWTDGKSSLSSYW